MEICKRCNGTGEMEVECCSGRGGCDCEGRPVFLICTYCDGLGKVSNIEEANTSGHKKYMQLHGNKLYHGSGPK